MPRQRQRIVFCDCYDCLDRPEQADLTPEQLNAATAVARQEPPPKALVICGSGFLAQSAEGLNLDVCNIPHLHKIVREGNIGLLAARQPAAEASGTVPHDLDASLSELAQLFGVYEELCSCSSSSVEELAAQSLPTLAARFKGMQASFASSRPLARRLAAAVGFSVDAPEPPLPPVASGSDAAAAAQLEAARVADSYAALLVKELGAEDGASGSDLLCVHLDARDWLPPPARAGGESSVLGRAASAGSRPQEQAAAGGGVAIEADPSASGSGSAVDSRATAVWEASCDAVEALDLLVKALLANTGIRERALLVVVLTPQGHPIAPTTSAAAGATALQPGGAALDPAAFVVTPRGVQHLGRGPGGQQGGQLPPGLAVLDEAECRPSVARPVQSFQKRGVDRVECDTSAPMVVARRLPGVVRRDRAEKLTLRDALAWGGVGCILAERLLPEVAYKIARAPKYGA